MVEADSNAALHRGMTGLLVRMARRLNRAGARRGQVFPDRYHHRVLSTPRQVRSGLCYVLNQALGVGRGAVALDTAQADPCSSAAYFDGWARGVRKSLPPPDEGPPPVAAPRSWLLATGWRSLGLVAVGEAPAAI